MGSYSLVPRPHPHGDCCYPVPRPIPRFLVPGPPAFQRVLNIEKLGMCPGTRLLEIEKMSKIGLLSTKIFRQHLERTQVVRDWRVVQVPEEDAQVIDISTLFTRIRDRVYDPSEPFQQLETDRDATIRAKIGDSKCCNDFQDIPVTGVCIADAESRFGHFIKLYILRGNEQATSSSHATRCGRRNASEGTDTRRSGHEVRDADHQAHTSNTVHSQESPLPQNTAHQEAASQELPMKDVQGTLRGKCDQPGCNCKGYRRALLHNHQLRCEYCDHTPAQHVTIIELGKCRECGKCDKYKYDSEEPCSDADCIICGCRAVHHVGAEESPNPAPQPLPQSASPTSGDSPVAELGESSRLSSCLEPVLKLLQHKSPGVTIKPATSQELSAVTQNFKQRWISTEGACPKLDCVYVITNTELSERWTAYQNNLDIKTVEQHYHGTRLACDIATTQTLCNNQDCGICGIAIRGLDPKLIRKNFNSQRFGNAFYLSPSPSKCHEYSQGCGNYRAMLLCDVCPGVKHKLETNDESLRGLPKWYDSVLRVSGGRVPELMVYRPDAVMPRYIVVYQKLKE